MIVPSSEDLHRKISAEIQFGECETSRNANGNLIIDQANGKVE